jgi:anti-sigma B factor antagonist
MEISNFENDGIEVIQIKGNLSAENVETLRSKFLELFATHRKFVFDLSEMENLDSTGLGTLVFCLKSCTEFNGTLILANLTQRARMIFEITKAFRIFDIYDELDEAIRAAREA